MSGRQPPRCRPVTIGRRINRRHAHVSLAAFHLRWGHVWGVGIRQQGDARGRPASASRATRVGDVSGRRWRGATISASGPHGPRVAPHDGAVDEALITAPPLSTASSSSVAPASSIALFPLARRRRSLARCCPSPPCSFVLVARLRPALRPASRALPLLVRLVPSPVVKEPAATGHEALCSAPLVRPARGCGRRVGRRWRRGADYSAS